MHTMIDPGLMTGLMNNGKPEDDLPLTLTDEQVKHIHALVQTAKDANVRLVVTAGSVRVEPVPGLMPMPGPGLMPDLSKMMPNLSQVEALEDRRDAITERVIRATDAQTAAIDRLTAAIKANNDKVDVILNPTSP